jgi:hypothetical protein
MLRQAADCVLNLIRAWAWLERLLKLVLLHFSAESDVRTLDLGSCLVLSGAREHVCPANSEIRTKTGSNNVIKVLIINGRDVGLVLAGAWHVEVLVASASGTRDLDTHVELGIGFGFFKVSQELVGRGGRREEVRALRVVTLGCTDLYLGVCVGWEVRRVTLGAYWN